MQYIPALIFGSISGLIGFGLSTLLSRFNPLLVFFIPAFFTVIGGVLFLLGVFGNFGWGNLGLLIYAMLCFIVAVSNWIVSIILHFNIKNKANRNV